MSRRYRLHVAGALLLLVAQQACAEYVYCSFTAAKQGDIQGDRGLGGNAKLIPVKAFTEEVSSPIDASTGLPTGKRQHMPVKIVKSLDSASPALFAATVENETLTNVTCNFYRERGDGGKPTAYFRVILTNARIVDLKNFGDGAIDGGERESISMSFQMITLEDLLSNTVATDDWTVQF